MSFSYCCVYLTIRKYINGIFLKTKYRIAKASRSVVILKMFVILLLSYTDSEFILPLTKCYVFGKYDKMFDFRSSKDPFRAAKSPFMHKMATFEARKVHLEIEWH